jgi:hypothetical protein
MHNLTTLFIRGFPLRWHRGCRNSVFGLVLLPLMAGHTVTCLAQAQETLLPHGASWRWRKGTNEVSHPSTAWRQPGFNDSAWPTGAMPFYYGLGGITGGTVLSDMRYNYTTVYLRRTFVVADPAAFASLMLREVIDDGFIVWINGVEVQRYNVYAGEQSYHAGTPVAIGSSPVEVSANLGNPGGLLVPGANTIAVQLFNHNLTSSDIHLNLELQATLLNTNPPAITSVNPPNGATVTALSQVEVIFNRPVSGVDAQDLMVNDQPATAVIGNPGTNRYTFTFTQPQPGVVDLRWNESPGIADLEGGAFDPTATNAFWSYTLADTAAPQVSARAPVPGATVSQLTRVELWFNEPVFGVDAADLRINGQPATGVTGAETGPYVFLFPQPSPGTVTFSWVAGHGIIDLASNAFVGGVWSVTLNPAHAPGDVIINEFVAGNLTGLMDEDGERPDWIELHNRGANAVNLLGWSLTDDRSVPGQWTFPSRVLNPGEYLVVFASGKDRPAPAGANRFHTNFKLDLFGEYLALFNPEYPRVAASEFTPQFPEQRNNYSYGLDPADAGLGKWRYFGMPTPGAANGASTIVGVAREPHFSVMRGLFDQPFNLLLTTTLPDATIRYTLNGSEPTLANGFTFSAPLTITNTTFVRAAVFAANYLPSRTRTHSYIYLDSVLTQPESPAGFPSTWGTYSQFPDNIVPADYGMDLDPLRTDPNNPASAIDPEKLQRYRDGMRELPIVSIVMDMDDLFNPTGFYHTPHVTNKSFPAKPCSVEMVLPNGTSAFAVSGGLGGHGNASREPRKNPKHGFKLSFRGEFGESTLEYRLFPDSPARELDDLIVRADFGSSWRHQSDTSTEGLGAFQRSRAVRIRDAWFKDTFRDMGQVASHNRFCHLFLNGIYWGTYDFTEQANASFAPNYYGGQKEDFDIFDQGQLRISGLGLNANYELMKQYLDITSFADYMLLHFFVGAQDWGNNKNWFAVRPRVSGPDGRFKYMPWDSENTLLNESINRVPNGGGNNDVPSGLFTKLDDNAQFRLDFADRVHKHMIAPGGALTLPANTTRWQFWQDHLDRAIVAESCRWGDYRRDVHPYQSGIFTLYTRENQWLAENTRVLNSYLPNRYNIVLNQLRTAGLYPALDAPEFRQNTIAGPVIGSGNVGAGYVVAMRNPGAGTIYYTTNGADPRGYYSGVIEPAAQTHTAPLTLNGTVTLKARVFNGVTWSALNEAGFAVGELGCRCASRKSITTRSAATPMSSSNCKTWVRCRWM